MQTGGGEVQEVEEEGGIICTHCKGLFMFIQCLSQEITPRVPQSLSSDGVTDPPVMVAAIMVTEVDLCMSGSSVRLLGEGRAAVRGAGAARPHHQRGRALPAAAAAGQHQAGAAGGGREGGVAQRPRHQGQTDQTRTRED